MHLSPPRFGPFFGLLLTILDCWLSADAPAVLGAQRDPRAWPEIIDSRPPGGWTNYHRVLWMGDTAYKHPGELPEFFRLVHEMGIDSITVGSGSPPSLAETNHLQYYVENVVNRGLCLKFNSKVTDWDRFITDWVKGGRP